MTEQQPYELVRRYAHFELRRYPPHAVAEIQVNATFDRAGNAAFRHLFNYITGSNTAQQKLAMTAPVLQSGPLPGSDKPADFVVAFVLPAGLTAATAPVPANSDVKVRDITGSLAAALRFTGSGSEAAFERHNNGLKAALVVAGLTAVGPPRFARFDPPFKPWLLRHNEVVQDVEEPLPPPV
ncbi:heme-binding protein [Arthrobacter sp. YAF34]|uniref:SOUL family heme-binding protein n=1 Tax=Arthrobacter sp. YAF34 TaxID=3233083 RepID=UPI003F93057C